MESVNRSDTDLFRLVNGDHNNERFKNFHCLDKGYCCSSYLLMTTQSRFNLYGGLVVRASAL